MELTSYHALLTTEKQNLFFDSETCGLHSMPVLLQFAINDGDIVLYEVWKEPVGKTLELLDAMTKHVYIGFNNIFDVFQICKLYTIWNLLPRDWIPEEHIEEIALRELDAQDGPCWKPYSAIDLLLLSRKGHYQSLMARRPIRIKRVPKSPVRWRGRMVPMAFAVANYLEENVHMNGIYFARTANPDAPRWNVFDRKTKDGRVDENLADIVLSFHPDGSLKSLAEHALDMPPKYVHSDIMIDKKYLPFELGHAPYALAVSSPEQNWEVRVPSDNKQGYVIKYAWPGVIQHHIHHWHTDTDARIYANDDITYTRGLYEHFKRPEPGDVDSILSCMVPAIRWHGMKVNLDGIRDLRTKAQAVVDSSPINTNKPAEVRRYILEKCDQTESVHLSETTNKAKLTEMAGGMDWRLLEPEVCTCCFGSGETDDGETCLRCDGEGELPAGQHPASVRAKQILDIKIAKKEVELYDKILQAGKLYPSLNVIGTLSSRMSGRDGINVQGIKREKYVRREFPLAWDGMVLCGGDFDSFEVTIADAVYNDPDLRNQLLSGKKLHGLFGTCVYPKYDYDQILDSEEHSELYPEGNMYAPSKSSVFAMIYGGNAFTLMTRLGVDEKTAEAAYKRWLKMFPGIAQAQKRITKAHQPLEQPDGPGSAIFWQEPVEYVESFLGFRRYFTLEYKIVRALFNLAQELPAEWRECKVKVLRSEYRGLQTAAGAVASALYGAAGQIADGIVRAAANHEIQSPGAEITKNVQCSIWELQPVGVNDWHVAPLNIHDEIMSVTRPDLVEIQEQIVKDKVESYRKYVPLIGITWHNDISSWADKKKEVEEPEILEEDEVEEILYGRERS